MAAMALAIFSPVFVSISLLRSMASLVSKSSRLLNVPLENPSSSASLSVMVSSSPSFTRILGEPQNFFSALSRTANFLPSMISVVSRSVGLPLSSVAVSSSTSSSGVTNEEAKSSG